MRPVTTAMANNHKEPPAFMHEGMPSRKGLLKPFRMVPRGHVVVVGGPPLGRQAEAPLGLLRDWFIGQGPGQPVLEGALYRPVAIALSQDGVHAIDRLAARTCVVGRAHNMETLSGGSCVQNRGCHRTHHDPS